MPTPTEKAAIKAANVALDAAATVPEIRSYTWTNNNAACWFTWFCLSKKILCQFDASFAEAEKIKMSKLTYWNDIAPSGNREIEARALADILTKLFVNTLGATYESGQNYASSLVAITSVLTDSTKTVCELSAVVDELHHFSMERKS